MKKLTTILLFLAVALSLNAQLYSYRGKMVKGNGQSAAASSLLNGIVGYWAFEETSGITITDATSNNLDGTLANVTLGATGIVNNAYGFDATTENYATWGTEAAFNLSSFTISVWVNGTSTASPLALVTNWVSGYGFDIMQSTAGSLAYTIYDGLGNTLVLTGSDVNDGNWYHIIATYDSGNAELYVNGTLIDSGTWIYSPSYTDTQFQVGTRWEFGTYYRDYTGTIDEVGVWNRVLTSDERTSLYNAGSGVTYPF